MADLDTRRYAATFPTDTPTGPVEHCTHPRVRHQHGTQSAYNARCCRCTRCTRAASRYAAAKNKSAAERRARKDGLTARERTGSFGTFELSPSSSPDVKLTPDAHDKGTYINTIPKLTPGTARAAALTVVEHATSDADARNLLQVLGIHELARKDHT